MVEGILGSLNGGEGSLREMGFRCRLSGREIQVGMERAEEMFGGGIVTPEA
ncbi:predicted protein [Sclerotinia sclerotiorum 1980 UF-70]|uniref:Uncharacterized protein n=1 Tax=Sclerotinia sclerotiorum (strain ATCC 18683 / 1980 / Ss-1) TaxID=665079 RepID=A7E6B4_SCLS1|nr:predicted protein [Sclerotinia sclerotiorum 1980 UF-70]EDN91436.1 predicted protein [Sclerotinia sclerotiorum 1980 UF-70]